MCKLRKIDTPSVDQLPALDGERITITWDNDWDEAKGPLIILLQGETEIWRGWSYLENAEHFRDICVVLWERYGENLYDVEPTDGAWSYLLCDDMNGDRTVQAARKRVRRKWHRRHKGC